MAGDMILTQPRPLTFCERLRMTFWLWQMHWRAQAIFLKALWSNGATVSFSRIGQQSASVAIGNGRKQAIVTASKASGTVSVTRA